jgi:hypothetical protein
MLKNKSSNGYSSSVRGWLNVDGQRYELAQVGPDFCILRNPLSGCDMSRTDVIVELVIEIDGEPSKVMAKLLSAHSSFSRKLNFCRLEAY